MKDISQIMRQAQAMQAKVAGVDPAFKMRLLVSHIRDEFFDGLKFVESDHAVITHLKVGRCPGLNSALAWLHENVGGTDKQSRRDEP